MPTQEKVELIKTSGVYDPDDVFEQAIQNKCKSLQGFWMSSYECNKLARAIKNIKGYNWAYNETTLEQRASFFFDPKMVGNLEQVVLPTFPVFVRDILENGLISNTLHSPIVLFSKAISHYIMAEFPVHIVLNLSSLTSKNKEYDKVGGAVIFNQSVKIDSGDVEEIRAYGSVNKRRLSSVIDSILNDKNSCLQKAAFTFDEEGNFKLSRGIDISLKPDTLVMEKSTGVTGIVAVIEPGDTGNITVELDDGSSEVLKKNDFEIRYSIVSQ